MQVNFNLIVHFKLYNYCVDTDVPCEYDRLKVETCRGYVNGFIWWMHANAMFDCLCILLINVLSGQNTEFCYVKADYLELPQCF